MKQTKLISLLLVICLVAALLVPGTVAMEAQAADGEENDGLVVNKTAKANGDGTYTITLEAYATGASFTTSAEVPTDIILVLDQSGSMADPMYTYTFEPYTSRSNSDLYNRRENQQDEDRRNLYYRLDSGEYIEVSVEREQQYGYTKIEQGMNNSTGGWPSYGYTNYWENSQNLYALINGEYQKVTVQREWVGGWFNGYYHYSYYVGNELIGQESYDDGKPTFSNIEGDCLYLREIDDSKTVYTYSYTPAGGEKQVIGTSVGANTTERDFVLYQRQREASGNRREALVTAVSNFVSQVNSKAAGPDGRFGTQDDVQHRVAVLGFASERSNTELLSIPGRNGVSPVNYNRADEDDYQRVLQDMTTENGRDTVDAAINELAASGATRADLGMDMAQKTLSNNPVKEGEQRNRVVIFFTDGVPTTSSEFSTTVANDAIKYSSSIKAAGAKVYAVGIFNGADATSTGDQHGDDTQKSNWFMQNVSSNNGVVPQTSSYYLSAADAGTLNSIFQQIAGQIQGGSSVKLDKNSVIRDVISPYFTLPEDATPEDITITTVPYTGENQWGDPVPAEGVTATIDGKQISVTGFDFSDNWCGPRTDGESTTYGGEKLVISFKVVPEDGFLGGNGVPTNENAAIYRDDQTEKPFATFPEPAVDVPIPEITVTAPDKNVYLLGNLQTPDLTDGAAVKAGEKITIDLDPTAENYGLSEWQNAFVDISAAAEGTEEESLTGLTEDTSYTLTVTVEPKTPGTYDKMEGSGNGNIYVFKPEITWQDSEKNIAETPDYETDNFFSLNWTHTAQTYDVDKMTGEEPALSYTYDPVAAPLTEETPVKVTVKIDGTDVTEFTSFVHQPCDVEGCKWDEYKEDHHFIVHVKSFDLTIRKTGCNETLDPNQTFVFKVTGPNGFSMEVVIVGNGSATITNLPAGTYTVTEDTSWSWRYEPVGGGTQTGSPENPTVVFSNQRDDETWLDGNAYCENVFDGITGTN